MRSIRENFERAALAIRTALRVGAKASLNTASRKIREKRNYRKWLKIFGTLDDRGRQELRDRIALFEISPRISVLLPVYDVDEKWLRLCIESVFKQIYSNWELCIVDDRSTKPHVRLLLDEYAAIDERVKLVFRETNGHISAASNTALELATGEFTVLLDHDDELSEDALFWVANELNCFTTAMMIYSDEDLIDENGRRYEPKFKPDWSRDLFYSVNMITHLSAYRTSLLREIGGFRLGFEGSQDYDLALRVIEKINDTDIRHIPRILYHWRVIRGSVAYGGDEKPYAHERARKALREHFERTNKDATVTETANDLHRVRYALPKPAPRVSLVLIAEDATSGMNRAKEILRHTNYSNLEIILVAPGSSYDGPEIDSIKTFVISDSSEAEAFNIGAAKSDADVLCFFDIDLSPRSDDWLAELVGFAIQDEIGAAGAKVISEKDTVSGGGLIMGVDGIAGFSHQGFPQDSPGNMARNRLVGNYSAVSVSCMAVRRTLFNEFEGFDSGNLPAHIFDADLCLRLGEKGFRIVFTPYATLAQIGEENRSNPTASEREYFKKRWTAIIARDPFYNPNLSKKDASFSVKI